MCKNSTVIPAMILKYISKADKGKKYLAIVYFSSIFDVHLEGCRALSSKTSVPPSCVLLVRSLSPSSNNAFVAGLASCKQKLPPIRYPEFQLKKETHCLAMASISWFTTERRMIVINGIEV
jgi:hypothetical protein